MANIFSNPLNWGNDLINPSISRTSNGNPAGFTDLAVLPTPGNGNVRQAKIANERDAVIKRHIVKWFLPEIGIVEMYINPQQVVYKDKKHHSAPTRTRGGYVLQYWGEELGNLSINGTTGSSGVEGINVLYDIYRNEQVVMDGLAQAYEAAQEQKNATDPLIDDLLGSNSLLDAAGTLVGAGVDALSDQVQNVLDYGNVDPIAQRNTLASLAYSVEMYWSGWVFRGYFTDMSVTESADKLGLFDYQISFMVTQKRGLRLNFMPWHRSAVNGPSNSDPAFGVPYSFGNLKRTQATGLTSIVPQPVRSLNSLLKSYRPL